MQALLWHYTGPLPRVLSSHYLDFVLLKKCFVFFQTSRVLVGSPNKKWKIPKSTLAPYKSTSKSEVFPTWAPLTNSRAIKASLPKAQALKFILQNCSFQNALFPNFNLQILSSKSNLRSFFLQTCSTSSFQKLVEKVSNHMNEYCLILKNEFGALIVSVF